MPLVTSRGGNTPVACTEGDTFCTARPRDVRKGMTVACFRCREPVCLSCSVRMPVDPVPGRTFGHHHVCHTCALTMPQGDEFVRRHLSLLGGKPATLAGGRRVPEMAPQLRKAAEAAEAAMLPKRSMPPESAPAKPYPQPRMETLGYARR